MVVLITGGAGFIGGHISDILSDVSIIDNLSTGKQENTNQTLHAKNVGKINKHDLKDVDVIIHCAAQVSSFKSIDMPKLDFKTNCLETFKLFETWRKYNPDAFMIYTSSRSVLGNIEEPIIATEETIPRPNTLYALHKLYGENLCKIYSDLYGMKYSIIRPANVYGVGQPYWVGGWYNFIAHWIKLTLEHKPIPIYGTGNQIRDYVYVTDVADAYERIVKFRPHGKTFQLATGIETTLTDLAKTIISLIGQGEIQYFKERKGDIQRFVGSYTNAKEILNWEPQTDLITGLKKEIEWLKNEA